MIDVGQLHGRANADLAAVQAEEARDEEQIAALRARKAQMDSTAYQRQLEDLLVQLATVTQELKKP